MENIDALISASEARDVLDESKVKEEILPIKKVVKAARTLGGKYLDTKGRVGIWNGKQMCCLHGKDRSHCSDCGGGGMCEHRRRRSHCKECGGSQVCIHGRRKSDCKDCGGVSICEHRRRRAQCHECCGSQICEHGKQKPKCKDCVATQICKHGILKMHCRECQIGLIPSKQNISERPEKWRYTVTSQP